MPTSSWAFSEYGVCAAGTTTDRIPAALPLFTSGLTPSEG